MANRRTTRAITWQRRLPLLLILALICALTALTTDVAAKQKRPAAPTVETAPRAAGEPIMAIVSIKRQHVTFYDADGWISRAPVSTGVKGRETPAGVFAVLEKEVEHYSSLYDDASMPHMQRITWNGVALHGGPLPGYAASHGCIRMPYRFAADLYDTTRIGMRVIIAPDDPAPVEFTHAALFEPDEEAVAAAPLRADEAVREAEDAAKAADVTKKTAAKAAREAAAVKASVKKLEKAKSNADAALARADKALAAARAKQAARAEELQRKNTVLDAATAAVAAMQPDTGEADAQLKVDAAAPQNDDAKADQAAARVEAARLKAAAKAAAKAKKDAAAAAKIAAKADQVAARAEAVQQKAAARADEAATKLDTVKADAQLKVEAAAAAKETAETAATRKAETAKAAKEAKLATEPVSVYISRATQKLYVRRNTHKPWPDGGEVFDSSIEVPVTIRDPDQPIGTHIFTAMAREGSSLRWTAVSIDEGDDAGDALDRVTIPEDALQLIGPTALPRSSIVVSDEPLSSETNYRTEFVAVLSNQPQGGFKTRKPTPKAPPVVRYDNWGSGVFGGYGGFRYFGQRDTQRQDRNNRRRRDDKPRKPQNWWW